MTIDGGKVYFYGSLEGMSQLELDCIMEGRPLSREFLRLLSGEDKCGPMGTHESVTDTGRQPPDPAQKFAERVVETVQQVCGLTPGTREGLAAYIATELRTGGWRSKEDWMRDIATMRSTTTE